MCLHVSAVDIMTCRINCTVVVNFKWPSYEVMEDSYEVTVVIQLSKPSSESFEVITNLIDITTECK